MDRFLDAHATDRRRALQLAAAGAGIAALTHRAAAAQPATPDASPIAPGEIVTSGDAVPELAAFDTVITDAMSHFALPGGQLAISRGDKVVFNRGYGYASIEDAEVVTPEALFRIASTTKPLTAVAILVLVDEGKLTLDAPVFPLLALDPPANAPRDPRLDTITVEQLLVHSGGWNSAATYDPQYLPWPLLASQVLAAENPAEGETIIRWMQTQPLDFDPGTLSAYSNFGFNVLGRVIDHVSGQSYEQFVIDRVTTPAGIAGMAIGGTTLAERFPGEVRYYQAPEMEPRASVYHGQGFVPVAYGSFYLRSLDAHGGWIASAQDLLKFATAIDGQRGTALLTPESVTAMETTPRPPSAATGAGNEEGGFGLGFNSAAVDGGGYEWTHAGALEGSNCSWLLRQPDGTSIAFVFNTLPVDYPAFFGELLTSLREQLAAVTTWPEGVPFS